MTEDQKVQRIVDHIKIIRTVYIVNSQFPSILVNTDKYQGMILALSDLLNEIQSGRIF